MKAEAVLSEVQSARNVWVRRAVALSWFTIVYNLIEGVVSIVFGISDDSTSLVGFGVDSLIEVASAFLVLWRFKGELGSALEPLSLDRERKTTRGIGVLFLALAVFTAVSAAFQLKMGKHPETTAPGIVVSAISLSFMFYLWRSKLKVANGLQSVTMQKDAACSLACIQLSGILFVGSTAFALFPQLWWADGVACMGLSFFIGREGLETVRAANSDDFDGGCSCH